MGRARAGPVRRPGLAHGRGAHARLHERRGARAHARDRRDALLEPLARRAVAQGRDLGQHPGACARCATTATPTRCSRSSSRPGPPATRASARCFHPATSSPPAPHEALPGAGAHDRRARRRAARTAPTPPSCSPTRRGSARRCARRPRRSRAPPREETDERVAEEAADVLYHLARPAAQPRPGARRRRGGARWPSPLTPRRARRQPSARRGARAGARAQRSSRCATRFIDDCETPVSAFLKLRERPGPAFLLESAEQGQRVGPLLVHRLPPAQGRALVAGRRRATPTRWPRRRSRATARRRSPDLPPFAGGAVGLLRLRPRAHRRAAGRAQPRRARAARHGADAHRRAGGLRPPQAHRHDPGQRLRRRGRGSRRAYARRARHDRRGARAARRAGPARRRRAPDRAPMPEFESNMPRERVRGDGRPDRRVRPRRRRLPGRALAALVGAGAGRRRSRSTAGCARSTRARTCTSWTSGTSRSRAPAPSRCSPSPAAHVSTRPIAGTRPRGADAEEDARIAEELLADEKERAEHVMLVDLGPQRPRAGLRVRQRARSRRSWPSRPTRTSCTSSPASPARCARRSARWTRCARCCPRARCRARPRSARCRSSTSSSRSSAAATAARSATSPTRGDLDTCIHIRTVVVKDGVAHIQAGGGTVADAKPDYEYEESVAKARGVLRGDRAGGRAAGVAVKRPRHRQLRLASPTTSSSTWASSGRELEVGAQRPRDRRRAARARGYDRVVVSPGPVHAQRGRASRSRRCAASPRRACRRSASAWATSRWPRRSAGTVVRGEPVHGKTADDRARRRARSSRGSPSPLTVGRYHSLVVDPELPDCLERDRARAAAWSWASATASCPPRACSSTPSRC